jgi:hypothetical protein
VLLLAGCTPKKSSVKPILKGISFECDVTYYNENYCCKGDVEKNGNMIIEFVAPTELEGLKFTFSDNGVLANFNEIEYVASKMIFESSAASLINEAFRNTDSSVFKEDDTFFIEGVTDDFEYKLLLGGTGLPIKITTRPDVATVEFKNVKIL